MRPRPGGEFPAAHEKGLAMTVARYISADVRERAVIGGSPAGAEAPMLLERTAHIVWREQALDEEPPAALAPASPLSARMLAAELQRRDPDNVISLPSSAYRVHAFAEVGNVDTDVELTPDEVRNRLLGRALAGGLYLGERCRSGIGRRLDMGM